MTFYINSHTKELLDLASDGSEDSFITEGFKIASDEQVIAFRAAQAAANAPSPQQILKSANSERDSLLANAGLRIAPLQDAVDLGTATEDEKARLKIWKEYRVSVGRVKDQPGFPSTIDWPAIPGDA
ncbi:tail fiber assembly protein [Pseudomonas extremaustralis]|uniref:tail fiber assembly protein n=1 Tax=Pseudomonas extremaustralis TaxID=359110 RepID=UPI001239BB38|nr:tail fiber assembly protein [Pseudomonas extremaustralis]